MLIALTSLAIAVWVVVGTVPRFSCCGQIAQLEKYLLEVFLIHTYLFVRPTGNSPLDFAMSLALIAIASYVVGMVADRLTQIIFKERG